MRSEGTLSVPSGQNVGRSVTDMAPSERPIRQPQRDSFCSPAEPWASSRGAGPDLASGAPSDHVSPLTNKHIAAGLKISHVHALTLTGRLYVLNQLSRDTPDALGIRLDGNGHAFERATNQGVQP